MFNESLQILTALGNTRARALLRLSIVEWSASRFIEALRILNENGFLFNKITNHAIKGACHSQKAMVLRKLVPAEKREAHLKEVLREYQEADQDFKLAHNIVFRADVKNNIGNVFRELSRFKEAHEYLEQARRLRTSVKDKIGIAQIDDTRAQVLIAERRFKEAEEVVRHAVKVLGNSGQQCLLADSLITHGIALARLGKREQAQFTFQRAMEVAQQVGALNKAGLAALSLIEELDGLPRDTLQLAFHSAREWLANAQSQQLEGRFATAADKVFAVLNVS
jgi:tetratricopeptide (TPR) repeat protein